MVHVLALAALAVLAPVPVRGLHISSPSPADLALCEDFFRKDLVQAKVNTVVLEVNYDYKFKSHPEVSSGGLNFEQARELAQAAKAAGIHLIPEINCLGHQSWAENNGQLLKSHPEFDETRGKYPGNKGIYCRSYCPLHPGVHKIVFDLLDEVAGAFQSDTVHVGMDEVFILADPDCPRCHGKQPSELFAGEVNALHDHLRSKHLAMWMWGDRFLNGTLNGLGEWEASANNTWPAAFRVPHDITVCDWHYDRAEPTAEYLANVGFNVISCPWRNPNSALQQLSDVQNQRQNANPKLAGRFQGVMETVWTGTSDFIRAYRGEPGLPAEATEPAAVLKKISTSW